MGPLTGYKIIEVSGIGPGPLAGMLLADLGAEVIRIDRFETAIPGPNAKFDITGRNKSSIRLNLKNDEGKSIFFKLIKDADAIIEGFRPGVMEKLGLGPKECLEINPRIVFGRITGWGQDGPLANSAGHDINYIALTGVLNAIGSKDSKPSIPLNLIGDYAGGTMFLLFGICSALLSASKTNKGQVVDAAMIDGVSSLMSIFSVLSQSGMWNLEERENNLFDGGSHFYNTYETSDNKFISIGSLEPKFYNLLKDKLGITDPQFNNQMSKDNWPELKIKTAAIFKTKTQQQWNKILENTDICYAPVLSLNEAKKHPHLIERGNFIELDGITQPSPAPRFSLTKSDKPKPAPEKGQDNNEILMNIGYSSNEIEDLIKNNTIK
jgi:alpha-methylacyl-CoA racemase|tara:strand:- start:6300 stop:7439 length:1140 start_codon:yes stop_codon:yes gene_type:complete